ncbi:MULTISPECIES: M35 family metallo-endopeptidase [unclassified Lysobacter]|uniref:M35 family metallo-endopeptidase n=1 Tax=unclassified Lysobacter TaxID=2635362 RepID=UPI0006FE13C4|nr:MULTISPECIES: M35 family metallo-endopeptidase [unclassified Lysobacter]KRC33733.1 protease [Lysobacter sp. Root76]KRD69070.1 protease [Lysobacter sp. Root96]
MKLLHVVSGTAVLAGAIAAATAAGPAAPANPLRVSISTFDGGAGALSAASVGALQGTVEIAVTNTSRRTVRLPKWQLPTEVLDANLFEVSVDGAKVEYQGPMIKRGTPQAADFAILRPGETYRTVVDLASAYDLSQAGDYTVTYNAPLQFASTDDRKLLNQANGLPMSARSAPLRLWVDGGAKLDAAQRVSAAAKPVGPLQVVNGVNYVGCTSSRITTAGQAVNSARSYSENAKGYLNAGTVGARYTTWFGAYTSSRYSTARQHFVSIDAAMDQNNGQITINCGCNQNYYAYVYPNQPYQIYVCKSFWTAPLTGTDSKAGTLIHEMSHFNAVAGTDDHVYGQSGAKNLAISNPANALDNADNHEYFAENTPFQN